MLKRERRLGFDESRLSRLFGIGIAIVYILMGFWATQLHFDPNYDKKMEQEKLNRYKMEQIVNKYEKKVERMDKKYTAHICFSDLRAIASVNQKLGNPGYGDIGSTRKVADGIQQVLRDKAKSNENRFALTSRDTPLFYKEAWEYQEWENKNIQHPADWFWTCLKKAGYVGTLRWFVFFYLRMVLLILPLFLFRMWQRTRGAKTIIAENPVCFILALIFWPRFFHCYPFDIFRELWVEAQIRRLGPLFRCLTREEQIIICQVASFEKKNRLAWNGNFQQSNEGLFVRTSFTALFCTVLLHICCAFIFLPTFSCSDSKKRNVVIVARAGPSDMLQANYSDDNGFDKCSSVEIKLVTSDSFEPELVVSWYLTEVICREQHRKRKIPHVPYFGGLIANVLIAIQSAREKILWHKRGNKNAEYYYGNLTGTNTSFKYCLGS